MFYGCVVYIEPRLWGGRGGGVRRGEGGPGVQTVFVICLSVLLCDVVATMEVDTAALLIDRL